jgi:hypothetical protein
VRALQQLIVEEKADNQKLGMCDHQRHKVDCVRCARCLIKLTFAGGSHQQCWSDAPTADVSSWTWPTSSVLMRSTRSYV